METKYYLFQGLDGASVISNVSCLTPELIEYSVQLNELPVPEYREGFYFQLHCDNATKEVWFEYFERPAEVIE